MESAIAFRLGPPFIVNAKMDCTVISVSPSSVCVKYSDNTKQSFKLGFVGGNSGGLTVAHNMVCKHKVGTKLKANMTIAYNEAFFAPDWANPGYSVFKMHRSIKVLLTEDDGTIEDSLALSESIGRIMSSDVIIHRDIVVNFDQAITNSVKVADAVDYDTVLCYVTEQSAVEGANIDKAVLEQLTRLGAHSPRAKSEGVVNDIVVYYNGDLSDMSPSLRKLVKSSNERLDQGFKDQSSTVYTGQVTSEYRINADPLLVNTAVIKYSIIQRNDSGTGDKYVLSSQLKCTVCNSFTPGSIKTEDGDDIDAVFGILGIQARIVNSPHINGSFATLVRLMTQKAIEAYDG